MKRLFIVIGVLALLIAATSAFAGNGSAATRVTIARHHPFHGRILPRSHKDACNDRKVKIFIVQPSTNKVIAKTHSKNNGRYSVKVDTHQSTYYAVATRKVLGDGFVCRRGESHPINFPA